MCLKIRLSNMKLMHINHKKNYVNHNGDRRKIAQQKRTIDRSIVIINVSIMRWPPRIKCTSIGLNHCCRRCSYCDCRIPCCVVQTINYSNLLKDLWLNHSYSKTVTMSFERTLTIQLSTTHIFQHIESNQLTTATQHTDAWFNHCMTKPINAYAIFESVCAREKKVG